MKEQWLPQSKLPCAHQVAEGTGIDTIVASGPNTRPNWHAPLSAEIENRDAVLLTLAPRYEGYHAAMAAWFLLGNPMPKLEKAYRTAVEAQLACQKALKPGVKAGRLKPLGGVLSRPAGYENYFLYSGFGTVWRHRV